LTVFIRAFYTIQICFLCLALGAPVSALSSREKENRGGEPVVLLDAMGRDYVLEKPASRIVSLCPGVTEILFAIGAGDLAVGITDYCDYPEEAQTLARVGGFSGASVSVERIALLRPDLVILSADMHFRIAELLDALDINYFAVEPRNFEDVFNTISVIGDLTGRNEGAAEVIDGMKEKLDRAGKRFSAGKRPSVFWALSTDPLMSTGRGTFLNEAIQLGGGRNIFSDIEGDWPLVSLEEVLLRKPDWILSGDSMDSPGAAAFSDDPRWRLIPAVAKRQIASVSADLLYRYGPRLADGVLAIAEILHP
jgi:iron complex transport system substrate-binding protein